MEKQNELVFEGHDLKMIVTEGTLKAYIKSMDATTTDPDRIEGVLKDHFPNHNVQLLSFDKDINGAFVTFSVHM